MLSCACSAEEMACVDEMKVLAGVASDANLVRIALWNLADHLDMNPPNTVFDLREHTKPEELRKPRRTAKRVTQQAVRTRQQQLPSADHPWRTARIS